MTQMTLTKALVELKKLDLQIARGTSENFIGYTIGTGFWEKPSDRKFTDAAQATAAYKSSFDSVQDLIKKRAVLKSALVRANAITNVKIGEDSMTIAEAIERKNSIKLSKTLLDHMRSQYALVVSKVTKLDSDMQLELSKTRDNAASTGKADESKLKQLSDDVSQKQKPVLNDPNKLQEAIAKLEASIEDFMSNVDVALSVANATTNIEV